MSQRDAMLVMAGAAEENPPVSKSNSARNALIAAGMVGLGYMLYTTEMKVQRMHSHNEKLRSEIREKIERLRKRR